MAISCMWSWMVPHFYIEFSEFRLALNRVSGAAWESCSNNIRNSNTSTSSSRRDDANRATVRGMCAAILIIAVIYIGSVFAVGIPTNIDGDVDEYHDAKTKSDAIIIGVGRMVSAFLLAYFSVELPRWLGVTYSSQKYVEYYKRVFEATASATDNTDTNNVFVGSKELSFRVCWSVLGHFFIMYPFLLLYFCNQDFGTVILSTGSKLI